MLVLLVSLTCKFPEHWGVPPTDVPRFSLYLWKLIPHLQTHLNGLPPAWLQQGIWLQSPSPHPSAVDNHISVSSCHLVATNRAGGMEGDEDLSIPCILPACNSLLPVEQPGGDSVRNPWTCLQILLCRLPTV